MKNYDFKNLSPIDFEILIRDLLQKELKVRLESFKPGKDSGIDFRYSEQKSRNWIIQAKQFCNSPLPKLLKELEHESAKVKKLKPSRYIVVTALGLTPDNKEKILNIFAPFITSTKDIYGKEDLNNLLTLFPEVDRQTFKLWLPSVEILEEILHSGIKNVSRDTLEKIQENAKVYVQNDSFTEALDKLIKHNICIIAGIPGIGKTTLADMLILHYVKNGFELVKINSDIAEANELNNNSTNRIYYYDDFLGQASFAEKLSKNEDQRLLDFIDIIRKQKKSKLILTTREYILNQAKKTYGKIENSNIEYDVYVIDLSKYTRSIRAKILFNHLYFSELPWEYKENLLNQKAYKKIVDHKNYNPRIIKFMTDPKRIGNIESEKYCDLFLESLNNPLAIWPRVKNLGVNFHGRLNQAA